MTKIATLRPQTYNIVQFVSKKYKSHPRPVLFWDTCALLNIVRFLGRLDSVDNPRIYHNILSVYKKIKSGKIYSVSSSVNSKEWDDNIDKAISTLSNNLPKMIDCSNMIIEINNELEKTSDIFPVINTNKIKLKIIDIATTIVKKTIFLDVDKEIAYNALTRVTNKRAPSNANKNSKAEFKDCSIWETMLELCRQLNATGEQKTKIFYTVNTDDFCSKDAGKPFDSVLLTDAATLNFKCCKTIEEVVSYL